MSAHLAPSRWSAPSIQERIAYATILRGFFWQPAVRPKDSPSAKLLSEATKKFSDEIIAGPRTQPKSPPMSLQLSLLKISVTAVGRSASENMPPKRLDA